MEHNDQRDLKKRVDALIKLQVAKSAEPAKPANSMK
jgi:hypothetical protein